MTEVYEIIKADIKATMVKLVQSQLIANPYFSEKNCVVGKISSRLIGAKIDNDKTYVENFLKFYNSNEYLFLFRKDHSFIQVNYEFKQDPISKQRIVSKANLNFYPNPGLYEEEILEMIKSDIPEEEQVEFWNSLKGDYIKDFTYHSNYMRLDYSNDPRDFTELTHPRCHIHFGLNNNFRLATNKLPLLSDFVDLVLFTSYIEDWKKLHEDELGDLSVYSNNRKRKIQSYIQLTEFTEVLTAAEKLGYSFQIL